MYGNVTSLYYMIYIFAGCFTVIGNGTVLVKLLRKNPKLVGGAITHIGFGMLLLGIIASSVYTVPMLDPQTSNYNTRIEQGEVFDDEGFPITQKVEMFELKLNQPKLINDKYMVTYEGYELTNSPRRGQQNYRLKFEPVDGGDAFYMSPEVYPMLTSSGPNSVDWSVDPHVRTGLLNDIYLYVAGSQYVEKRNKTIEESAQNQSMVPVGNQDENQDDEQEEARTIEISRGETTTVGPFSFTFRNFVPASGESLPENTQIGIRSLIHIEHEPSGSAFEAEPLFAVYTEEDRSYTYSPPIEIQEWGMNVLFSSVHPESDSIELTVYGLDENFEEDWVLVVAEQKPFVSVVWMGTFMLMAGFSISIFRHWAREKNTAEKE